MWDKGVLFDYNGVLVGDEHLQQQAMAETIAEHGAKLTDDLYDELCLGRPDKAGFEALQERFEELKGVNVDTLIEEKILLYQRIATKASIIYPNLDKILEALHAKYILGVVTGSLEAEIFPVLESGDLRKYFNCVVTANDISRGKPYPEGYLKGATQLGLAPSAIVVIEDTAAGVTAAKAAGMKCIALEHTTPKDRLAHADLILPKLSALTLEVVERLLS